MALRAEDFIQSVQTPEFSGSIEGLRKREYSDLIDSEGHQYIDLVLEGGGVLGVALLGYIYVLEEVGIRFLGIGGTSAGAVTATFLAASGTPSEKKSGRLIELVANMPMASFVDGPKDSKRLIDAALAGKPSWYLAWRALHAIGEIRKNLGMNPGDAFLRWATDALDSLGVSTVAELRKRQRQLPLDLRHRDPTMRLDAPGGGEDLCIVAADISTETRVEFPKMASLYWADPEKVHPAKFVRASMSVPGFFSPFRVTREIKESDEHRLRWQDLAGFSEEETKGNWMPREYCFVDGGIMSNFPIDAFHKPDRVPNCPTFGAKLQLDERCHRIDKLGKLASQVFNSARHVLDYEFVKRNQDYKHLVAFIDTGEHEWLKFEMTDKEKLDLFRRGADCALRFLSIFDWRKYKLLREKLAASHR